MSFLLTHKVGLPPNHKVPKTHYNFPLYPVMVVVGVKDDGCVWWSWRWAKQCEEACPHIEDGRSGKVQPLQKRRLPNIRAHPPEAIQIQKIAFLRIVQNFLCTLGGKKGVYVRVKAKLTLFSFMLTFPFQHTFLSLFSWIIPWGTKVWETPVTFVAQSAFRFFYIGQSCTKCILIGVIFPPCVRYWFGILKLWKRYWFDILKLRYGFDILKLWKWQRFSFSKFSHQFIASILECIKSPSLSILKCFQCDHNAFRCDSSDNCYWVIQWVSDFVKIYMLKT